MYALLLIITGITAFVAGMVYETVAAEVRRREAIARSRARKARQMQRKSKDTLFFATVKADAPGARR